MALAITNRGTDGVSVAATSVAVSPGSNFFLSDSLAVMVVAYDNSAAAGGDPFTGCTDTLGNTWTSQASTRRSPGGAANDGTICRILTTPMDGGAILTSTVITLTFSVAAIARVTFTHVVSGAAGGSTVYLGSSGLNQTTLTGASTTPSSGAVSVVGLNCIIGGLAEEGDLTPTADSDTTNGSWSTQLSTTGGSGISGQTVASQGKVVLAPGNQTYNPTLSGSRDWAVAWIQLGEGRTASPTAGAVAVAGAAPNLYFEPRPTAGAVAVQGYAPTILEQTQFPTPGLNGPIDMVWGQSTSTGQGALTLTGTVAGYQAFATMGSTWQYVKIEGTDGSGALTGEWEICFGYYDAGANTFTRSYPTANWNGMFGLITWGAGTKLLSVVHPAEEIMTRGRMLGITRAIAMGGAHR